ncbi:MAG: hypothetical protein Q8P72_02380 [Candidatus Roizmanbacteria bacterium]|nr:hypothetical protein [Candidatus Roizmanbacteria bacterium]
MRTFLLSAITLILVFLGAILMFIRGNSFITPSQKDPLSPTPTAAQILTPTDPARFNKSTDTWTCPSNGWIDCMPMVVKSRAYQCEKEFISWAENTCPGFEGVAY